MIADKELTRDTQDIFVNHLLKIIDGIFSEALNAILTMSPPDQEQ